MVVQELFGLLGLKIDEASWAKGDKFLGAVKAGFAAVVAGFGLAQIADMIKGVSDVADAAVKASAKLGVTVEAVQELGYAAKLSDIQQGELEGGLGRLAKGLDDVAQTGKGPTADALRRLGISFKDLKGESLDANLEVIADAFAKMPDGAAKSALAADLFGRQLGSKFIPLLNGGADGLRELRAEAQELGIVVGEEAAKQFEEFNDNQTRLSETWRGLKVQVVTALLPALTELVDKLQHWISENREVIATALDGVIKAATLAFQGLIVVLDAVTTAVDFFRDGSDEAMAILIALTAVIVNAVVPALISMVAGWVAAAAPILAVVAAIALVAYGIIKLVKHWDQVKAAGAKALDWIKDHVLDLLTLVQTLPWRLLAVFVQFGDVIYDALSTAFDKLIELAKGAASAIWSEIKDIPVIGRIAAGAEFVADELTSGPSVPDLLNMAQQGGNLITPTGPSGVVEQVSNMFTTQVTVNPSAGMNEEQIGELAASKAAEANKNMLAAAMDAYRGGRR